MQSFLISLHSGLYAPGGGFISSGFGLSFSATAEGADSASGLRFPAWQECGFSCQGIVGKVHPMRMFDAPSAAITARFKMVLLGGRG